MGTGLRGMGTGLQRYGNESRNMDKIRPTHNLRSKVEVYVQLQEADTHNQPINTLFEPD